MMSSYLWVVHNFKQQDRKALFKEIFAKLNDGGKIIVMDKIYPNGSEEDRKKMLDVQIKRYDYLDKELRDEIVAHEKLDYSDDYRMDEPEFINELGAIGFRDIRIMDRVERDVVLVASK